MAEKKSPLLAHDVLYKKFFSESNMVESLLRDFIIEDFRLDCDFTTLERVSGSYVSDDLRERHNDIVWRVFFRPKDDQNGEGAWCYLYLLLEFQSTSDPIMALRVLSYTSLLLIDIAKQNGGVHRQLLSPVFSMVIYTGKGTWQAKQLNDLFPPALGALAQFQPSQTYFVLDASTFGAIDPKRAGLATLLLRLEKVQSEEELSLLGARIIDELKKPQYMHIRSLFCELIRITLKSFSAASEADEHTQNTDIGNVQDIVEGFHMLSDSLMAIADKSYIKGMKFGEARGMELGEARGMELGEARGIELGKAEGKAEGMRTLLLGLASQRWGVIPAHIEAQVQSMTNTEALERLSFALFAATSLQEFEASLLAEVATEGGTEGKAAKKQ